MTFKRRPQAEKTKTHASLHPPLPSVHSNTCQQLGGYSLIEEISVGVLSRVYKAVSIKDQEETFYAIKILNQGLDKRNYARFQREAKILQQLNHRFLPKFISQGLSKPEDGFSQAPYIAMEFIVGDSLEILLQSSEIKYDMGLKWAWEICEGVKYLHQNNIVHSDLKPANIKVTWPYDRRRNICILDLGLSFLETRKNDEVVGSLPYMSPEQFGGQVIEQSSDIYSLGLVLFELLNHSYAYNIEQDLTTSDWKLLHHMANPQPMREDIPAKVATIILKCLSKEPKQRPTAKEIATILNEEISSVGTTNYIGLFGSKGSGKTCYSLSLYHKAEVSKHTRDILEDDYLALYSEATFPATTATHRRLQYNITHSQRSYNIITKDYSGEILDEDDNEIYEFLQSCCGIIIFIDFSVDIKDFSHVTACRHRLDFLMQKLAVLEEGIRKVDKPIALVLSKWDTIDSADTEDARERALNHIQSDQWLSPIFERLNNLCLWLQVFPVYSFTQDQLKAKKIRPFNIEAPVIWIINTREQSLFEKCQKFHDQFPTLYPQVMEKYWHLLRIEHIYNSDIRKQVEQILKQLSSEYLQQINNSHLPSLLQEYQKYIGTKGITYEDGNIARKRLRKIHRQIKNRRYLRITSGILLLLLLVYGFWEAFYYSQMQREISSITTGQATPQQCLQKLQQYRETSSLFSLRSKLGGYLLQNLTDEIYPSLTRELSICKQIIEEIPAPTPDYKSKNIRLQQVINEQKLTQQILYKDQKHLNTLMRFRKEWLDILPLLPKQQQWSSKIRDHIQKLEQHKLSWKQYLDFLNNMNQCLIQGQKILNTCIIIKPPYLKQLWQPSIKNLHQQLVIIVEQGVGQYEKLKRLQKQMDDYLQFFPHTPLDIDKNRRQLEQTLVEWHNFIQKLETAKKRTQDLPSIEDYPHPPTKILQNWQQLAKTVEHAYQIPALIPRHYQEWQNIRRQNKEFSLLKDKIDYHLQQLQLLQKNWKNYQAQILTYQETIIDYEIQHLPQKIAAVKKQGLWSKLLLTKYLQGKDLRNEVTGVIKRTKLLYQIKIQLNDMAKISKQNQKSSIQQLLSEVDSLYASSYEIQQKMISQATAAKKYQQIIDHPAFILHPHTKYIANAKNSLRLLEYKQKKVEQMINQYQQATDFLEELNEKHPDYIKIDLIHQKQQQYQHHIKKFSYIYHLLTLLKWEKQAVSPVLKEIGLADISLKLIQLEEKLGQLNQYKISMEKFTQEDYHKLTKQQALLVEKLKVHRQFLSEKKQHMALLQQKSLDYINNWSQKITTELNYEKIEVRLNQLIEEVIQVPYLEKKYGKKLEYIKEQLSSMRKNDSRAYREIANLTLEHRFIDVRDKIDLYLKSSQHGRIRGKKLQNYRRDFVCELQITIKLSPSQVFDDGGGGAPDFRVKIIQYNRQSKDEKWQEQYTFPLLSQDDVSSEVNIGSIRYAFDFNTQNKFAIEITEVDTFDNDEYGIKELDNISERLLNNETVQYTQICGQDGEVTVTLEPEYLAYEKLK